MGYEDEANELNNSEIGKDDEPNQSWWEEHDDHGEEPWTENDDSHGENEEELNCEELKPKPQELTWGPTHQAHPTESWVTLDEDYYTYEPTLFEFSGRDSRDYLQ